MHAVSVPHSKYRLMFSAFSYCLNHLCNVKSLSVAWSSKKEFMLSCAALWDQGEFAKINSKLTKARGGVVLHSETRREHWAEHHCSLIEATKLVSRLVWEDDVFVIPYLHVHSYGNDGVLLAHPFTNIQHTTRSRYHLIFFHANVASIWEQRCELKRNLRVFNSHL